MTRALAGACALVVAALTASGCGTVGRSEAGTGDALRGKQLFTEKCGQCHALADAGTEATIGPNLDDAFVQSRADGLGETTIQSVVRGQIAYPTEFPPSGETGMPANIVTGEDAEAVAAYVASVAARPTQGGAEAGGGTGSGETEPKEAGGETDGAAVFTEAGCGSCHTFAAAGSTGTIGPNLDETKPSQELALERVRDGMGAMPAFGDRLSPEQIAAVAEYVAQNAGG